MNEKQNKINDFVAEGFEQGWKHMDASQLTSGKTLETDVVVIGSGAGGGNANKTVEVNKIPPKNANASIPFVFCFTIFQNQSLLYLILRVMTIRQ